MSKLLGYIIIPFRHGGLGALLGGTIIIFIGEVLEFSGGAVLGPYGCVPGFLIKIGAICLCLDYASQVLRTMYEGADTLPFWEIHSLEFLQLLKNLIPFLVSLVYGLILTFLYYVISTIFSNTSFNLIFFFTRLNQFGISVFFAIFFPLIYFIASVAPDDIVNTLNLVLIIKNIVKSMPGYLLFIPITYFLVYSFIHFRISLPILGAFLSWFIKFYFFILYAIVIGKIYAKIFHQKEAT